MMMKGIYSTTENMSSHCNVKENVTLFLTFSTALMVACLQEGVHISLVKKWELYKVGKIINTGLLL